MRDYCVVQGLTPPSPLRRTTELSHARQERKVLTELRARRGQKRGKKFMSLIHRVGDNSELSHVGSFQWSGISAGTCRRRDCEFHGGCDSCIVPASFGFPRVSFARGSLLNANGQRG